MSLIQRVWGKMLTTVFKPLVLYRTREKVDFSFGWFTIFVTLQTIGWLLLVGGVCYWLTPELLLTQLHSSWISYLIYFVVAHTIMGLFEYLFHRYTLHSVFWRSLWFLQKKHSKHHGLTHVVTINPAISAQSTDSSLELEVRNKYPILSPEQIDSSTFPGYALVTFWGVIGLAIVPMQLLLPNQPILITGFLAVSFSFWLYEVKHAIEHLDYEKFWKPRIEKSKFIRELYGFHLMHHSRQRVNQAIGGVFGIPLWDILFGTYYVPKQLPLPNSKVDPAKLDPPKPIFFIQWLDKKVDQRTALIKQREADRHLAAR